MFALVLESEPMKWADLPASLVSWIQDVGGIAACVVILLALYRWFIQPEGPGLAPSPSLRLLTRVALACMVVGYVAFAILTGPVWLGALLSAIDADTGSMPPLGPPGLRGAALILGAMGAILAVSLPVLVDMASWCWRRIWALARLSLKEAVRRRVLWVFTALLLVFLFAGWFMDYKPENQVRNYVDLVYVSMSLLLLATAGLLAAFSIPADLRSQTMHTIVTKPVERFEIVLGRFIGYMLLMTLVLAAMTSVSLLYVFREIDPDAKAESMRARVPIFGKLAFFDSKDPQFGGDDVGREWTYRRYLRGSAASTNRGIWSYSQLPASLATRPDLMVPCEFSFDIFRTLKGEEGRGIFISIYFTTRKWNEKFREEYRQARDKARSLTQVGDAQALVGQLAQEIVNRKATDDELRVFRDDKSSTALDMVIDRFLADKYGYFEISAKEIDDYHTQTVQVPAALFKNALDGSPPAANPEVPLVQVSVKCESGGQYLGLAKYDFYILASERSFALNFFKGTIGIWLSMCIVVGVAVVLSTYLSGVISLIVTGLLLLGGVFQDGIREIAEGKSAGGGPMESLVRLVKKEALVTTLEATPGTSLAMGTDRIYGWVMSRVLNVIPDVDRLTWKNYVMDGFDIGFSDHILLNAIMVAGYLIPFALAGYYLMKWREIAS